MKKRSFFKRIYYYVCRLKRKIEYIYSTPLDYQVDLGRKATTPAVVNKVNN